MTFDEDAIREQVPGKTWDDMSLWEKSRIVMCGLDSSADLTLERRVQQLEHQIETLRRELTANGDERS